MSVLVCANAGVGARSIGFDGLGHQLADGARAEDAVLIGEHGEPREIAGRSRFGLLVPAIEKMRHYGQDSFPSGSRKSRRDLIIEIRGGGMGGLKLFWRKRDFNRKSGASPPSSELHPV